MDNVYIRDPNLDRLIPTFVDNLGPIGTTIIGPPTGQTTITEQEEGMFAVQIFG